MKKILKIVMILIGGAISLLLIFIGFLAIKNNLALGKEAKIIKKSYGQMVKVDGRSMCVDVEGTGEEVIVLSPGLGSTSPVLEMKGLIEDLKQTYTVVTIEPFGYGLSDQTDQKRSIENITKEMHEALSQLGYKKYMLMGHSISGVYALYYANQYPDEVMAYVGLDSSVPKQILEEDEGSLGTYSLLSWMNKLGMYRFLASHDSEGIMPKIKGYEYTDKERKVYEALVYRNFFNKNVLDEFKYSKENFNKAMDLSFGAKMPVLYMLSSENCNTTSHWQTLHEAVITRQTQNQIVVLESSHYLHYEYSKEIVSALENWRAENNMR